MPVGCGTKLPSVAGSTDQNDLYQENNPRTPNNVCTHRYWWGKIASEDSQMKYDFISADCHIDLIWLPPDLFTANAPADLKDRMPYVIDTRKGKMWVAKNGAKFGLMNGMGSAGREYVPGQIHRSDRMASTGLYDDGRKGIRRLTDPELRLKDQERDGVQAEVLYGILGASMRLKDDEAATEMLRIYNQWLGDFCRTHPDRYAGLASIPSHDIGAAGAEIKRVSKARV